MAYEFQQINNASYIFSLPIFTKSETNVFAITRRLVAHALNALGLDRGSAIAVDMPMNIKSVFIYLAIVLAGYVVVSIADSFASSEISTRLKISKAKAIFTQVIISLLLEEYETLYLKYSDFC